MLKINVFLDDDLSFRIYLLSRLDQHGGGPYTGATRSQPPHCQWPRGRDNPGPDQYDVWPGPPRFHPCKSGIEGQEWRGLRHRFLLSVPRYGQALRSGDAVGSGRSLWLVRCLVEPQ